MEDSKKARKVVRAYSETGNLYKTDPLGMYTGRPAGTDALNAIKNGYKIYMKIDDSSHDYDEYDIPQQDADDL